MALDGQDHIFRVTLLLQNAPTPEGVVIGVSLVIEVVQKPGYPPLIDISTASGRRHAHDHFHRQPVAAEAVPFGVLIQQGERLLSVGHHQIKAALASSTQALLTDTVAPMPQPAPDPLSAQVSEDRLWGDLTGLAEFVESGLPGWTRRVFSAPYQASRRFIQTLMEEAGLIAEQDSAGNLIGRLPGADSTLPAIVIGSHTDTVTGGGRFDGMVGVAAAVEVARQLLGSPLRHPLWVVDFLGEEPNEFGLSCLGSRAVTGHLGSDHLQLRDGSGRTLGEALTAAGCRPADLHTARWRPGSVHAYLELHIEQGRLLEQAGLELGVVTAIVGIARAQIDITGSADHAGTTPMDDRHDALAAAAEVVLGVDRLGRSGEVEHGVATTGRILIQPNAANVVPGLAQLVVEMRSTSEAWLRRSSAALEEMVAQVAKDRSVEASLTWISSEPPVSCDPRVRQLLGRAVEQMGSTPMELESGASHDAAHVARVAPIGMLFVPSRGGRSHCPEEWTDPSQVADGARALLRATIEADAAEL